MSPASASISAVACTCSVIPVAETVPVTVPDHGSDATRYSAMSKLNRSPFRDSSVTSA